MRSMLLGVFLLLPLTAVAACPAPADWARRFHAAHAGFHVGTPSPALLAQITAPLGALLMREADYAGGEVGHLDHDPWLGAQDGEVRAPAFAVESIVDDAAVVSMRYRHALDGRRASTPRAAHLVLRRQDGCWRLHDLLTPRGDSLSQLYAQP